MSKRDASGRSKEAAGGFPKFHSDNWPFNELAEDLDSAFAQGCLTLRAALMRVLKMKIHLQYHFDELTVVSRKWERRRRKLNCLLITHLEPLLIPIGSALNAGTFLFEVVSVCVNASGKILAFRAE